MKRPLFKVTLLSSLLATSIALAAPSGALLREHIEEDTLLYLRVPELVSGGTLSNHHNELNRLYSNKEFQKTTKALAAAIQNPKTVEGALKRLGVNQNTAEFSYAIALLSRINSPLEVAVVGQSIENLSGYLTAGVEFESVREINQFLQTLGVPPTIQLSPEGDLAAGAVAIHFDTKAKRLYLMGSSKGAGLTELEAWKKTLNSRAKKDGNVMSVAESRIDPSGDGLFFWMSAPKGQLAEELAFFIMMIDENPLFPMLLHPDFKGLSFGAGKTDENRGQIRFVIEGDTQKVLGYSGSEKTPLNFETLGTPQYMAHQTLPSIAEWNSFENHILNYLEVDQQEAYRVGKEKFKAELDKKLGFDSALFVKAFGPDIAVYKDDSGDNTAIRIRDKAAYKELTSALEKSAESAEKKSGVTHYHFNNQSYRELLDFAFSEAEPEARDGVIVARFLLAKWVDLGVINQFFTPDSHLYLVEDNDWVFVNSIPQPLIERKKAKFKVAPWLKENSYRSESAFLGGTINVKGAYQKYYYGLLERLQVFGDEMDVPVNLNEFPLYSDLRVKESSQVNISLDWTKEYLGWSYQYELLPTDYDYGYGSTYAQLYMVGVAGMFALPAYQDYGKRQVVAEGLMLSAAAKMAATEYYATMGEWPADNQTAGLSPADAIRSNAVRGVEINENVILIHFDETLDYGSVILEGSATEDGWGSVVWNCYSIDIADRYLPANCRF